MKTPRRPSYVKALQKQIPTEKEIRDLIFGLSLEDSKLADYSIAVIGASLLDKALGSAILAQLRPLEKEEREDLLSFTRRAPLSDFSAKIKMAYAMRIIGPQTRDDLECVRHIRNLFAHHPALHSFTTEEIAKDCANLHLVETLTLLSGYSTEPRERYISTCSEITSRLRQRITMPLVAALQRQPLDTKKMPTLP